MTRGGCLVAALASAACAPGPSQHRSLRAGPAEVRILQKRADRLLVELPNRLLVVAQQLKSAPVVSAQVWVKTGSIYEGAAGGAGAGLSHFLEHLVSGGTTQRRGEKQSNALLGSIGARTNASTSLAAVRYYINTTSDHAAEAVELLSDWLQNSEIIEAEFTRERDVIQREFQMGQGDPRRILWKLTQQARYRTHPARHPTIGYLDEFLEVSRDQIYDFYKRMYVPNNMVFVVVGDIDMQQVVDQIATLWRDAPPRELPSLQFPIEPAIDRPHRRSGVADITRPRLRLAWPGTRLAAPGDYALDLLAVGLGGGESSRLVRTVRDEQRLVNTIGSYNLSMSWGEGFFAVDAEVAVPDGEDAQASIDRVESAILNEVERVRREGLKAEELARAQRQTKAQVVYGSQTAGALAGELASGLVDMHDPDYRLRYAEAVQKVTRRQVQDAARKFLDPDRLISVRLMPLPPDAEPPTLSRPADEENVAGVEMEAVDLDNAVIRNDMLDRLGSTQVKTIATDQVRRAVLPNGLRLLVGRHTAVPAVAIQFYQLGGLLADEPGREGLANATAQMMIKGTATRSADAIARQIDNLGARLSVSSGYNSHYADAVCLAEDWPDILELLGDVTLNPSFTEDEWSKMRPRLLAGIDRVGDRWTGELAQHFRKAFYVDHPWSHTVMGRREVVEGLTVDDLKRFHLAHLGASKAVLAVFGDVDPDEVIRRAESVFGPMPSEPPRDWSPSSAAPPIAQIKQFQTKKPMAAAQIGFGPGATRQSPDYPGLRVLGNVLNDFPGGWLQQALRGSEGLAYAVWAYPYTGLAPGFFAIVFNTKPNTVSEALSRSIAVTARARSDLVDETTLVRAKAGVLTNEFFGKQSNADRAREAALAELYGMGLDEPKRFLERVGQIDAEQLRSIARKYLVNPVVVVMSHELLEEQALEDAVGTTAASHK